MLFGIISNVFPQSTFRSGVFLHHSTGGRIYDYDTYTTSNECSTSVPNEMSIYNASNGYVGINSVSLNEDWFASSASGLGNDWYNWHWIFDNKEPQADIYPYFTNNKIIIIKSCIPSSHMSGYGSADDTTGANVNAKTVFNYKWHWRSIVKIMESYPENFFVIWTGAPACSANTTSTAARLSHEFNTWAKDTLAAGLDPTYGAFPPNVYVFDFFHRLVDGNYFLSPLYRASETDDHPNAAAADLIAPLWVGEMFDASIAYETIIPVELTSFTASIMLTGVELNWSTATELNNDGFEIERSKLQEARGEMWEVIGFVKGQSTSTHRNEYSFFDKNTDPGKSLYRLKQIDFDGNYAYSKVVEVDFNYLNGYSLEQNYPNPFNPATSIRFNLPYAGNVKLEIYNILGEEIITLVNEYKEPGVYNINFDANGLNSGVYIYKMQSNGFIQSFKMTLIK